MPKYKYEGKRETLVSKSYNNKEKYLICHFIFKNPTFSNLTRKHTKNILSSLIEIADHVK